jgi:pimeloyl-ACP methyl ester carboxylesterase
VEFSEERDMAQAQMPFTTDDARLCMELAAWAYLPFENDEGPLRAKLDGKGLALVGTLSERSPGSSVFSKIRNDTQAFCATGDGRRYIVFRGSEPKVWDWLTDFRVDKEAVEAAPGTLIHEGFFSAISGPKTRKALNDWIGAAAGSSIVLAGHSLGGALAACVAVLYPIIHAGLSFAACYTFGQPRIGLIGAAPATPIHRVVNRADIVPRVPVDFKKLIADTLGHRLDGILSVLTSNALGLLAVDEVDYRHVGTAHVIGEDGRFAADGETAYARIIVREVEADGLNLLKFIAAGGGDQFDGNLVADHFQTSYIDALKGVG